MLKTAASQYFFHSEFLLLHHTEENRKFNKTPLNANAEAHVCGNCTPGKDTGKLRLLTSNLDATQTEV